MKERSTWRADRQEREINEETEREAGFDQEHS